jgi:Predicted permease, DMT superfamily
MTEAAAPAGRGAAAFALPALIAGAVAMGVSPVFVRSADVGPFASAFHRVALALPLLFLWARSETDVLGIRAALKLPSVWAAGLFFAGDLFFWHLAIVNTTMANATFLATMAPVWVVLGSGLFIGEPVERSVFLGLAAGLAGATILIGGSYGLAPERLVGDLYGFVTSVFFGAYFLAARVARRHVGPGTLIFASSLVTSLALLAVALVAEPTLLPGSFAGFAALGALALLSHAGGQGLLAFALGHLSAAFSSLVIFLEAVAAALFGYLVFGERLGLDQAAGGLLILAGLWIARPRPRAR